MMRMTPLRLITRQRSQRGFTDARTFIVLFSLPKRAAGAPLVRQALDNAASVRGHRAIAPPGPGRPARAGPEARAVARPDWASTRPPFSSSTANIAFGQRLDNRSGHRIPVALVAHRRCGWASGPNCVIRVKTPPASPGLARTARRRRSARRAAVANVPKRGRSNPATDPIAPRKRSDDDAPMSTAPVTRGRRAPDAARPSR